MGCGSGGPENKWVDVFIHGSMWGQAGCGPGVGDEEAKAASGSQGATMCVELRRDLGGILAGDSAAEPEALGGRRTMGGVCRRQTLRVSANSFLGGLSDEAAGWEMARRGRGTEDSTREMPAQKYGPRCRGDR